MRILENIEPKEVFYYFEELCKIPHGSFNTKPVADWLVDFAKNNNLEYSRDNSDNVIIIKEATSGYEEKEAIILQGHTDMVCQKTADSKKDMDKEGIDIVLDGDCISAKDTTLGADNGIAVAMIMAVLASSSISHPRIEAVFTSNEEVGLLGASEIDLSNLSAKRLINIDSEDEGVFTVSCAGGNMTKATIPVEREDFNGKAVLIKISGLSGGHSGIEIDKGRANANILMGRALYKISKADNVRLVFASGGLKDNAIPVETVAKLLVTDENKALDIVKRLQDEFKNEYSTTDKNVKIELEFSEYETPMTKDSTRKIISFLMSAPNGVEEMSADVLGLVQTSLNLGVLKTEEDKVTASFCVRSSKESQKIMLTERVSALSEAVGGNVEVFGDYPGWDYKKDSPLRDLLVDVFKSQYGYEPKIEAIHAGLECGILASKIEGLDSISIGPDLKEVHTPRERMSACSVERVWKMLLEVLKR